MPQRDEDDDDDDDDDEHDTRDPKRKRDRDRCTRTTHTKKEHCRARLRFTAQKWGHAIFVQAPLAPQDLLFRCCELQVRVCVRVSCHFVV